MPVFFIQSKDVVDGTARVSPPLLQHLSKSLRIRVGDRVTLNDERARRYYTTVVDLQPTVLIAQVIHQEDRPHTTKPSIILGQGILKGEKMGWVIQKATELGVKSLAPLKTDHAVPRVTTHSATRHQERWDRIALEAAQQSERWTLPVIHPTQSLSEFLHQLTQEGRAVIALTERQPGISLQDLPLPEDPTSSICLMVGPEGGWSREEMETMKSYPCTQASLGSGILRAETASLAALAILQARLGNL